MMRTKPQQLQKPPPPPPKPITNEAKHWSQLVNETVVSSLPEESLCIVLQGGADNGYFCYIGDIKVDKITYHSGKLQLGNILLEIQGQKVSGYTLRDCNTWLKQVSQNGAPVMIKSVSPGLLPKDLHKYLQGRFQKASVDHDLQQTIRDNLYMRTVPCTTRSPRPGEVNGVDYTFLSIEEFQELEKGGTLLESGLYDGNHYGTPKPPKEPTSAIRRVNSTGMLPGGSSEKLKRSQSNTDNSQLPEEELPPPMIRKKSLERAHSTLADDDLPPNWEMALTPDGQPYFINHTDETTHWVDPRTKTKKKATAFDCDENELPFGWEKVEDPHYGAYYIDHVNKKTQYENPVFEAKRALTELVNDLNGSSTFPRQKKPPDVTKRSASDSNMSEKQLPTFDMKKQFTKIPSELKGEIIKTSIVKSIRGFGFTIIGGDHIDEDFLQIKNVVPNGPAYLDGKLKTGDVIVYVNGNCVLGYTHQDVVGIFQKIPPGDKVNLEICRGYGLPFDPDDPNTEIVTTVAVTMPPDHPLGGNETNESFEKLNTSQRSIKSLPDLTRSANVSNLKQKDFSNIPPNPPDVLSPMSKPETLTMEIVKGPMGFGFTIADSIFGQKVKQILDRPRCKNLQENDILIEINQINVSEMNHIQVVQVLKDCPKGVETTIIVQRGGVPTSKLKRHLKSSNLAEQSNHLNSIQDPNAANQPGSYFFTNHDKRVDSTSERLDVNENVDSTRENSSSREDIQSLKENFDETDSRSRSRTPTNEGQDRPKTPILGGRPKTPVENSRPKTPTQLSSSGNRLPLSEVQNVNTYQREINNSHSGNSAQEHQLSNSSFKDVRGNNFDTNSRPPLGPKMDSRDDHSPRSDSRYNHDPRSDPNYPIKSNFGGPHYSSDRRDYERSDANREPVKPGMFRSRTPGPDMMNRIGGSDHRNEYHRPKTPTANDMRSKTPVPQSSYSDISSRYHTGQYGGQHYGGSHRPWIHNGPSHTSPAPHRRIDTSFDSQGYPHDRSFGSFGPEMGRPPTHPQSPAMSGRYPRQSNSSFEDDPHRVPRHPMHSSSSFPSYSTSSPRLPGSYVVGDDGSRSLEMTVNLLRHKTGFGFRIVGGTEEGSQVSVGHIVPGGAADLDGRIQTGDEIIYVDGLCVINASHHKVVHLMGNASLNGRVSLGLRRQMLPSADSVTDSGSCNRFPYDVTVNRQENEGFGFVIISSMTKSGSTIGRILENSPAERCGKLYVGDRILAVQGVDISKMHHEDIVNLIKDSGYSCTLTIGSPIDDNSSTTSQRSSANSMVNASAFPSGGENEVNNRRFPTPPDRPKDFNKGRYPGHPEEDEFYTVELHRGSRGFGFSIRGGREFNDMPLYVLRIADGGAADVDGRLRVGDQLLEINGYITENMTHTDAIELIQNGGPVVRMLVKRTGKPPPTFDTGPSSGRYPQSVPNGPLSHSSPHLMRRNISPQANQFYNNSYPDSRYPHR